VPAWRSDRWRSDWCQHGGVTGGGVTGAHHAGVPGAIMQTIKKPAQTWPVLFLKIRDFFYRVCSIKCVKVKSIKLNNFDHGKTTIKKAREENAFGRDYS
jgi:hypothetical protein